MQIYVQYNADRFPIYLFPIYIVNSIQTNMKYSIQTNMKYSIQTNMKQNQSSKKGIHLVFASFLLSQRISAQFCKHPSQLFSGSQKNGISGSVHQRAGRQLSVCQRSQRNSLLTKQHSLNGAKAKALQCANGLFCSLGHFLRGKILRT